MTVVCLYWQEKLRFQAIRHAVTKVDCQPTAESGVIMLVTGQLKVLYACMLLLLLLLLCMHRSV